MPHGHTFGPCHCGGTGFRLVTATKQLYGQGYGQKPETVARRHPPIGTATLRVSTTTPIEGGRHRCFDRGPRRYKQRRRAQPRVSSPMLRVRR
jgi:hypothetical protein